MPLSGRLRAVLDTNVLLDLWLFDDARTRPLRAAIDAGRLHVVRSRACDDEFARVLARERFGLDAAARQALLARWQQCGEAVEPAAAAPLASGDPDDQKFLDTAFAAAAELLLTRDKALLRLARRAAALGLRIAEPVGSMTYDPGR